MWVLICVLKSLKSNVMLDDEQKLIDYLLFQISQETKHILHNQHHITHNSHFHFAVDDIRLSRRSQG